MAQIFRTSHGLGDDMWAVAVVSMLHFINNLPYLLVIKPHGDVRSPSIKDSHNAMHRGYAVFVRYM
jgi:hypothetical protein